MSEWMQELTTLAEAEFHARRIVATLATVDEAGRPRARTVFIRWFDEAEATIWITTDDRSEKMKHLMKTPVGELVIWTPHERQQFRLFGQIEVVRSGPVCEELWSQLKDAARAMFFGPPPGEAFDAATASPPAVGEQTPPPPNFVLLALRPTEVESLELNYTPHLRRRWRRDEDWKTCRINP
jgi:PPOX class probable FMN-dependent enzyme